MQKQFPCKTLCTSILIGKTDRVTQFYITNIKLLAFKEILTRTMVFKTDIRHSCFYCSMFLVLIFVQVASYVQLSPCNWVAAYWEISANLAYDHLILCYYLIVNLVFSHLGFWS